LLHYLVKVETPKMHVNTNSAFNVNYEIASVSSATFVLIAHSVLQTKVVVIFDYEGRTSS